MGWMYMAVCICDFIIFPVLWSIVQAVDNQGVVTSQWHPLTLEGAGLFHMAMGAVLGIAAFGRTQEKLAGVNNDNRAPITNSYDTGYRPVPSYYSSYSQPIATTTSGKKIVPVGYEPEL